MERQPSSGYYDPTLFALAKCILYVFAPNLSMYEKCSTTMAYVIQKHQKQKVQLEADKIVTDLPICFTKTEVLYLEVGYEPLEARRLSRRLQLLER